MSQPTIGIVIQGPTAFAERLLPVYAGYPALLWSTWKNEPPAALARIRSAGVEVLLNDPPLVKGESYINYQCVSTYQGILALDAAQPCDYYLKVRPDMTIDALDVFLDNVREALTHSDLAFLGGHKRKGGYLMDYIVAGRKAEMLRFWEPALASESGKPFPETWLQTRYFGVPDKGWLGFFQEQVSLISLKGTDVHALKWNYRFSQLPPALYLLNRPPHRVGWIYNAVSLVHWLLRKYLFKRIPVQKPGQALRLRQAGHPARRQ